jgi:hypothetical protein
MTITTDAPMRVAYFGSIAELAGEEGVAVPDPHRLGRLVVTLDRGDRLTNVRMTSVAILARTRPDDAPGDAALVGMIEVRPFGEQQRIHLTTDCARFTGSGGAFLTRREVREILNEGYLAACGDCFAPPAIPTI